MMSNFLKVVMKNKSFKVEASMDIPDLNISHTMEVKIDTGCGYSTIPIKKLAIFDDNEIRKMKGLDITNNVKRRRSWGVETGGEDHTESVTYDEMMADTSLKFRHRLDKFILGGMDMGRRNIYINYNRKGNILIGMDILSQMEFIVAPDIHTGQCTFLGCLKDRINYEYLKEVYNTFGIIRTGPYR